MKEGLLISALQENFDFADTDTALRKELKEDQVCLHCCFISGTTNKRLKVLTSTCCTWLSASTTATAPREVWQGQW
jgi:hypothetical protein